MTNNITKDKTGEKNNKAILSETLLLDEAPILSLAEKLRERKKAQSKKNTKRMSWGAFGVFFIAFLYWGFMPFPGTVPFALCKVLIELNVPYPQTLGFTEVAELRTGDIRIWFTYTDAFGAFRQDPFLCSFSVNEETKQPYLTKAKWGTVDIEQKKIDLFNQTLPFLISKGYYDTTYPAPLPDSIEDMELEIDKYRRVNIMDLIQGKK